MKVLSHFITIVHLVFNRNICLAGMVESCKPSLLFENFKCNVKFLFKNNQVLWMCNTKWCLPNLFARGSKDLGALECSKETCMKRSIKRLKMIAKKFPVYKPMQGRMPYVQNVRKKRNFHFENHWQLKEYDFRGPERQRWTVLKSGIHKVKIGIAKIEDVFLTSQGHHTNFQYIVHVQICLYWKRNPSPNHHASISMHHPALQTLEL